MEEKRKQELREVLNKIDSLANKWNRTDLYLQELKFMVSTEILKAIKGSHYQSKLQEVSDTIDSHKRNPSERHYKFIIKDFRICVSDAIKDYFPK